MTSTIFTKKHIFSLILGKLSILAILRAVFNKCHQPVVVRKSTQKMKLLLLSGPAHFTVAYLFHAGTSLW